MCVCASLLDQWKTARDKAAISNHLVSHKKPSNGLFGDVSHDLDLLFDLLFESQRFESRPFRQTEHGYLANGGR